MPPKTPKPWDALRLPATPPPIAAGTFKISTSSLLTVTVSNVNSDTLRVYIGKNGAGASFAVGKKTAQAFADFFADVAAQLN